MTHALTHKPANSVFWQFRLLQSHSHCFGLSVWRTENSISEWWGVQRTQLRPCLLDNGDRGKVRETETCFHGAGFFPLVYHFQWKIPIFSISNTHTLTHSQAYHKDRTHSNQSFEYPLCYKEGKWLMHIWIKVQLKDVALSYGCYSSIKSSNTSFQRQKKVAHSYFFLCEWLFVI